jgi:hypothetical protein
VVDTITTYKALSSGIGVEKNKIMAWLFEKFGVLPSLIIFKLIAVALMAGCCVYLPQIYQPMEIICPVILGLLDAFYLWVAVNNVKVLKS